MEMFHQRKADKLSFYMNKLFAWEAESVERGPDPLWPIQNSFQKKVLTVAASIICQKNNHGCYIMFVSSVTMSKFDELL